MQEMFMGIAMHLAIPEKDRVSFAKKFYDVLAIKGNYGNSNDV